MAEMSPPRRRMIEYMTIRNLSPATQQSYLYAVSKFSRHFGRTPDRLGVEDVRAYLVHLASKGFAWSSLNQTVCALRFFYGVTLGQTTVLDRIPFAREPRKLPTVLSADEVVRFSGNRFQPEGARGADDGLMPLVCGCPKSPRSRSATSTAAAWCCGSNAARAARSATPHALRDAARHPARLLAAGAAEAVPVSKSPKKPSSPRRKAASRSLRNRRRKVFDRARTESRKLGLQATLR